MLPNLSVLSLRCAPCGVTKQRFSALLPGMSLAEGEREPDVAEQDKTCQICQVYLRWPSWGFQPSDGDVYDKQKAYDKADIYTQEDQRAEYFSMADLAAEQIRTSDPSRTEIELLLPGCGDQFHKACISRWAQGSQQGHNRCPSCMASIDPTIMSTLTASGPPRDGKRARDVLGETVVEVEEEDESDDDEDDEDDEDHPSSYFFNIKRAINNVRARAFDVTDVDDVTTTFLWQFAFPSRYVQEDMVAMSVDTDACRMYLAAHHLPGTEVEINRDTLQRSWYDHIRLAYEKYQGLFTALRQAPGYLSGYAVGRDFIEKLQHLVNAYDMLLRTILDFGAVEAAYASRLRNWFGWELDSATIPLHQIPRPAGMNRGTTPDVRLVPVPTQ